MSSFQESEVTTHRPIDPSDPGFRIKGVKLRWISTIVHQNNPDRPWVVLKKTMLPKGIVTKLEESRPDLFGDEEKETIRRGGGSLILAYAKDSAAKTHKDEIRERAKIQDDFVAAGAGIVDQQGRRRDAVTVNETSDVTQEMLARFKNK